MFKKHKALASIRRNILSSRSGSILGATLIILGIVLVSALSVSFATLKERKASTATNKSNQAFQTASDGIELVMQDILNGGHASTTELNGCQSSGLIVGTNYTVELRDADENVIACNSGSDLALVKNIKSVGSASDNQRAIEAAVAAMGDFVGTCPNKDDMVFLKFADSACTGIWHTCTEAEVLDAGHQGCLPSISQYVGNDNISRGNMCAPIGSSHCLLSTQSYGSHWDVHTGGCSTTVCGDTFSNVCCLSGSDI